MRITTLSAFVLILGAAPLLAQSPVSGQGPVFDFAAADADGDGMISREEWGQYLTAQAEARRAAMIERRAAALMEAGDADGDGLLSTEELTVALAAQAEAHQARMSERRENRAERHAERRAEGRAARGEGHQRPRHGGHGRRGGMPDMEQFAERSFDRMDANDDGQISAEEFAAAEARWAERAERRRNRAND